MDRHQKNHQPRILKNQTLYRQKRRHVHLETSDDYRKMSKIFEQERRVFHIQTCRRENIEDRHERNLSSRQNRRNQRRFHRQGL